MSNKPSPLDRQVGGTHYASKVQHVTFCQQNRIPWCEAAAIKYIIRHRKKNGRQDVEKALHYLELCIHEEYVCKDTNPVGMRIPDFNVATGDFLQANGVPVGSPEYKSVYAILQHHTKHGESTLRDAIRLLEGMLKTYPETPKLEGLDLL